MLEKLNTKLAPHEEGTDIDGMRNMYLHTQFTHAGFAWLACFSI